LASVRSGAVRLTETIHDRDLYAAQFESEHERGNGISAMTRYALILGMVSLLAVLSSPAHTQSIPSVLTPGIAWRETPSIVLLSTNADSRIGALREAVDFWNSEFSMLGSPFRLGRIVHSLEQSPMTMSVSLRPTDCLRPRSSTACARLTAM
jgi:hypothetical protein